MITYYLPEPVELKAGHTYITGFKDGVPFVREAVLGDGDIFQQQVDSTVVLIGWDLNYAGTDMP